MPTLSPAHQDWLLVPVTGALSAVVTLLPGTPADVDWVPVPLVILSALLGAALVVHLMGPVLPVADGLGLNVLAVLTLLGLVLLLSAPLLFVPYALLLLAARTLGLTNRTQSTTTGQES